MVQEFALPSTPMHCVESLGVPHTEVARLEEMGDGIHVHPYAPGAAPVPPLIRFLADVHVKTLARYLRMLGFDTAYNPHWHDRELAQISAAEQRILLTMDRGLLKRKQVVFGSLVLHEPPAGQLARLVRRYALREHARPLSRCIVCNGVLVPATREELDGRVPARSAALHQRFFRCMSCGRPYWEGSHHARMQRFISRVLGEE